MGIGAGYRDFICKAVLLLSHFLSNFFFFLILFCVTLTKGLGDVQEQGNISVSPFFHSVSEWVTRWIGLQRGYLVVFLVCGVLTLNFCIAHLCSFKYRVQL